MSTAPSPTTMPHPEPRIDVRRGSLWMLLSLVCFTGNALLIKYFSTTRQIDPWVTMSFRFVVGLAITAVIFAPTNSLNVRSMFCNRLLASRGALGALGTAAYYLTIGPLGAGRATLIGNTWCVWAAILAAYLLREKLGVSKFIGILTAVAGLLLLTDISPETLARDGKWELVSLVGAITAAMVVVVIRQLTRTETSATIYGSQCVYGMMLAIPLAATHVSNLGMVDCILLFVAGIGATIGQLAMTEGFRFLTVAAGGAFQITLPLLISLGGVIFFGEHFTAIQLAGAVLICAGSFQTVIAGRPKRSTGQEDVTLEKSA